MKRFLFLVPIAAVGGCVAAPVPVPVPVPAPTPAYHALGTEPFWSLTIDQHDLVFTQPEGEAIRQPRPQPIIGVAGEIYQTPRIHVNIVHSKCSDGMSDRTFPDSVQVDVDGRRFEGCGGL